MSENNNANQDIKKALDLATKSLLKTLENVSEDTKEKYKDSEKDLRKKQQAESFKEELEKQEIEDRKSNRKLREKYANKMFWYMCKWSIFVFLILICSGFKWCDFQLDKWVLITLIGSATIGDFTIVRAIIEGIFKNKNENSFKWIKLIIEVGKHKQSAG